MNLPAGRPRATPGVQLPAGWPRCAKSLSHDIEQKMCAASNFDAFEHNRYLNLESFRQNGQGVRTPVWFAGDPAGGHPQTLYVYSEADSGKAKRIRRNSRVRIAPCDMKGKLVGNWMEARAEIVTGEEAARGMRLLNRKYAPWKQLLDFFSKFRTHGRVVFGISPE
jgi:PPOX class probable F420-dependent enzyme